jgi:hypothetical protein
MRVETPEEIPDSGGLARGPANLGAASRAAQSFLAVIDGDDSLFRLVEPLRQSLEEMGERNAVLAGSFLLAFRRPELACDRKLHQMLLENLVQLLREETEKDALTVRLCTTANTLKKGESAELALWMQVEALGETVEQARLRWDLGITHVQQALLFLSRSLRQYLGRTGR